MADIHAMLTNWGRWVRAGHGGISQCESIEGNYRRNRIPGDTETSWGDYLTAPPPEAPLPMIDVLQALAVERIMRWLPKRSRRALTLHYVFRVSDKRACDRLRIAYHMWDDLLYYARLMVWNRLRMCLTAPKQGNILSVHAELPHLPRLTRSLEPVGSGCNGNEEVSV